MTCHVAGIAERSVRRRDDVFDLGTRLSFEQGIELISIAWFGMSLPETRSSDSAARAAMQLRRMVFVSVSEAGGRFGRSLKGRPGSKVMSMYPAPVDTFSEHVDSVDMSPQRVDAMRMYRHILPRQAGEPTMSPVVDRELLALLRAEGGSAARVRALDVAGTFG